MSNRTSLAGVTAGERFRSWSDIQAHAARAAGGLASLGIGTATSEERTMTASESVGVPNSTAPAGVPVSDADPFSIEFFEDPHRIHNELREAGPAVWLSRYGIWAVARYKEVR